LDGLPTQSKTEGSWDYFTKMLANDMKSKPETPKKGWKTKPSTPGKGNNSNNWIPIAPDFDLLLSVISGLNLRMDRNQSVKMCATSSGATFKVV